MKSIPNVEIKGRKGQDMFVTEGVPLTVKRLFYYALSKAQPGKLDMATLRRINKILDKLDDQDDDLGQVVLDDDQMDFAMKQVEAFLPAIGIHAPALWDRLQELKNAPEEILTPKTPSKNGGKARRREPTRREVT